MTGLERNGDVVQHGVLCAAAGPRRRLAMEARRRSGSTTSAPTARPTTTSKGSSPTTPEPASSPSPRKHDAGLYTSAVLDERTHELIVKAINYSPNARPAQIKLQGMSTSGTAKVTTLQSPDLKTENTFDRPKAIAPVMSNLEVKSGMINTQVLPYSLTVYRIPAE